MHVCVYIEKNIFVYVCIHIYIYICMSCVSLCMCLGCKRGALLLQGALPFPGAFAQPSGLELWACFEKEAS